MIIILGAGLSGLSLGYFLRQKGNNDFLIVEKENVPGGLCRTEREGKYLFDYTGHLLHFKDKKNLRFVSSLIPLVKNRRKTFIYSSGVFTHYPFQENTYGLPAQIKYDCVAGFIEAMRQRKKYDSFHSWILSHFGRGIAEHFMFPYNRKLFRYPLEKITTEWFSRFIPTPGLREVLLGALSERESGSGYNAVFYYPEQGGISLLPRKLYEKIKDKVALNKTVTGVDLKNKQVLLSDGELLKYSRLVSSVPAPSLAGMTASGKLKSLAGKLKWTDVLNINLGLRRKVSPLMNWAYFPGKETNFYRAGFHSSFNSVMAPSETSSLYIEISRRNNETYNIKKEYEKTVLGLKNPYGIKETDIIASRLLRISPAYVIYDKDRTPVMNEMTGILKKSGIHLIGRFGRWEYSTMEESIIQARELAETL